MMTFYRVLSAAGLSFSFRRLFIYGHAALRKFHHISSCCQIMINYIRKKLFCSLNARGMFADEGMLIDMLQCQLPGGKLR
jgi:hypothetical protein